MKRIATLCWVCVLTLGLIGCDGKGSAGKAPPADPNAKPEEISTPGRGERSGGPAPEVPAPPPPPPSLK